MGNQAKSREVKFTQLTSAQECPHFYRVQWVTHQKLVVTTSISKRLLFFNLKQKLCLHKTIQTFHPIYGLKSVGNKIIIGQKTGIIGSFDYTNSQKASLLTVSDSAILDIVQLTQNKLCILTQDSTIVFLHVNEAGDISMSKIIRFKSEFTTRILALGPAQVVIGSKPQINIFDVVKCRTVINYSYKRSVFGLSNFDNNVFLATGEGQTSFLIDKRMTAVNFINASRMGFSCLALQQQQIALIGCEKGEVMRMDLRTNKQQLWSRAHQGIVVDMKRDQKRIASICDKGIIKIWDIRQNIK